MGKFDLQDLDLLELICGVWWYGKTQNSELFGTVDFLLGVKGHTLQLRQPGDPQDDFGSALEAILILQCSCLLSPSASSSHQPCMALPLNKELVLRATAQPVVREEQREGNDFRSMSPRFTIAHRGYKAESQKVALFCMI